MTRTPAETAPDQVARLLALVPYLLSRGEVRLEDAARHFDVPTTQLDKDLRLLFMTGVSPGLPGDLIEVDIDALEGDGIIRVSNADYLARPVRFAPAEATALIVALRTMLEGAADEVRPVLQRTLAKLEEAAGQEPSVPLPLHVDDCAPEGGEHTEVIETAIAQGRQIEIDYYVPSRDRHEPRVVDPRALARVENVVYLDAWCHSADADRVFRLDRILEVRALETSVVDQEARARDLTETWFAEGDVPSVTLRLRPEAFWVSEYFPIRERRDAADGRIDVDLPVASEAWLIRLLMRLAPYVEVVDASGPGESYPTVLARTLNLYRPQG
jgi:proteasome accessory factor C